MIGKLKPMADGMRPSFTTMNFGEGSPLAQKVFLISALLVLAAVHSGVLAVKPRAFATEATVMFAKSDPMLAMPDIPSEEHSLVIASMSVMLMGWKKSAVVSPISPASHAKTWVSKPRCFAARMRGF